METTIQAQGKPCRNRMFLSIQAKADHKSYH